MNDALRARLAELLQSLQDDEVPKTIAKFGLESDEWREVLGKVDKARVAEASELLRKIGNGADFIEALSDDLDPEQDAEGSDEKDLTENLGLSERSYARLLELQGLLRSATLSGDRQAFLEYEEEYKELTEEMSRSMFGNETRDPIAVVREFLDGCEFQRFDVAPFATDEFCISDMIYGGEGFFPEPQRRVVKEVGFALNNNDGQNSDMLRIVRIVTDSVWAPELQSLGRFSADTGAVLVLSRRRRTDEDYESVERSVYSVTCEDRIRAVESGEFSGLLVNSGYGAGYDLYVQGNSLYLDFSGIADDPEMLYSSPDEAEQQRQ